MADYVMFLYSSFNTMEEAQDFCSDVFPGHIASNANFVIEGAQNILVIFDSERPRPEIATELYNILTPDFVKFYFLFEMDKLITANIPESMRDFVFNRKIKLDETEDKANVMIIDFKKNNSPKKELNLDEILEKIDKDGVESLTTEERDFLDNFNKN